MPPSPSGQARVLGHLLAGGDPAACLMLLERPPAPDATPGEEPPGGIRRLQPRPDRLAGRWPLTRFPKLNSRAGLALATWRRAGEIVAAARGFRPQLVLACTGHPLDLPAGALAAARLGLPFIAYLFDDPVFQWPPGLWRDFAGWAEPRWSRRAATVIVPNEFMARDFIRRTGQAARIIRNPVAAEAFAAALLPLPAPGEPMRVVYTGSVYHAQADAIVNLLGALEQFAGRLVLELYTSQSREQVEAYGVRGPLVRVLGHVSQAESYAVQRSAGLLFLPLAFNSSIPEVLDSSAPGKLGEYLASRRPLLVHAPATSFLADHIRRHDAGFVVDQPDPACLATALDAILAGGEEVTRRQRNAFQLAALYRAETARDAFWQLLDEFASGRSL